MNTDFNLASIAADISHAGGRSVSSTSTFITGHYEAGDLIFSGLPCFSGFFVLASAVLLLSIIRR